jgi:co-chaperonin GroES (HSP10)
MAEIVAVGHFEDGIEVDAGDVVVPRKMARPGVKLGAEEHRIVEAEGILGVVEG